MTYQSKHERRAVRILVAESRRDVRSALRLLLEQGSDMVVASEISRAEDLLEQVRLTRPDVITLDCDLPGLRTEELLAAVRSICPRVWVVALCSRSEARAAALSAGADAFVSKADPPRRLLDVIKQGCQRRASEERGKPNGQ
jgi:DNA-binding NarL/FixJ family response regulator